MADEDPQEVKIEPDDPQYQLQEHVAFKRRQQALNIRLKKLFQENLSEFRLIMDGSTYAFTKLNLSNKGVTAISEVVTEYPHLRVIELNSNQIIDTMHIQKLRFLVNLNLSRNIISDGRFLSNAGIYPYLKHLNLSFNKLKSLPHLNLPKLIHLNLTGNQISTLEDFDGHQLLEVLELRGNKITNLKGLQNCAVLRELFLADNQISSLKGISKLPKIQKLHLRKNKIVDLSQFPDIKTVKYLNLRENQISKIVFLSGIQKNVTILNILANPITEELGDNAKKEIWMKYRQYQKINKSQVTTQERQQFDKEYKQRVAQQQRQQKQAREQAEREALEKEQQA